MSMANKHYHVFNDSGSRVGPVIELPDDASDEDLLTELLATHADDLPELQANDTIRFVRRGQTMSVYGDVDQICTLVILPA
jgi:hypothetical protein